MNRNLHLHSSSTEWDDFYVECSSKGGGPIRNNTPPVLIPTQPSGAMAKEILTISSVASPQPQVVTIDSNSNEPTFPNGSGYQHPYVPPSHNDVNLQPNPFNVLTTMPVIRPNKKNNPKSSEPSDPSQISTPPMNLGTIEGWETPHTTRDDNTLFADEEPRLVFRHISDENFDSNEPSRISLTSSPSSTAPPPAR